MKRLTLIALLVLILLSSVGCSSKPTIIGKWETELYGEKIVFEFKKDGRLILTDIEGVEVESVFYRIKDNNIIALYGDIDDYTNDINGENTLFSFEDGDLIIVDEYNEEFVLERIK